MTGDTSDHMPLPPELADITILRKPTKADDLIDAIGTSIERAFHGQP